ncbi:36740_t:CDS:2, partial [Racocetra persica]
FAALFVDLCYTCHLLMWFVWEHPSDFLCAYATWGTVFFALTSIFFIVCINLHIIFVNEYRIRFNFEKFYFIISLFLALILSLLPVSVNMYGYDHVELSCWYRDTGEEHCIIWQWITFFGWVDAAILYCA